MPPREPTNAQISSRLSYSQNTPSFLQKFKNRAAGIADAPEHEDSYYDEDGNAYYDDGTGRPPIPQRPSIPERPEGEAGSEDEDDGDEKPQVVVLRQGKHLTEREAENERRKERGLAPLPDPTAPVPQPNKDATSLSEKVKEGASKKAAGPSLSFSSGTSKGSSKSTAGKRKAIGEADPEDKNGSGKTKKKKVKGGKSLLSFGDDEP
ncbi:hypothetical protein HWV62_4569 [Athelia sp. TMB]|nr:hypothetical protein HWV62_4820 [Athelia sp. TMB]KAF7977152.1 hypothetical protein HWV62_4569 [Athelia sp. TMB]